MRLMAEAWPGLSRLGKLAEAQPGNARGFGGRSFVEQQGLLIAFACSAAGAVNW